MPKKILYAEDEADIAAVLRSALESAGYEVAICDNGRDVLPTVESFKPDLLLLDLMMPGLPGLDIVRHMSMDPDKEKIPVVVTTALAHAKKALAQYAQVRHFLVKPFSAATLLKAVKECLPPSPETIQPHR